MGSLDNNIRLIRNETVEGGNTKERIAETFELLATELERKVNKDANKGLSSNDFSNEHKNKLEGLQQVDTSGLLPKGTYTGNASSLKSDIDKKVDKVAGKGLSSNDYTNEEKRKNEENALKRVANITVTGDVNKIITITFADSTVMQAPFKDNDHIPLADVHMNSLNFNENTGVLTGVKSDGNEISVSLDGRYSLIGHNHDEQYSSKTHTHNEYALRTHRHNWDDIDRKPNNLATTENVKTAIEGIQVGGRNLLRETKEFIVNEQSNHMGFTWSRNAGEVIAERFNGNVIRKITNDNYRGINAIIPPIVGRPVIISFWAKTTGKGKFINFATSNQSPPDNISASLVYSNNQTLINDGQWHRYTIYNPNGMYFHNNGGNGFIEFTEVSGEIYYSSIKIEIGNTPTDWSPSPEDFITPEEVMRKITRTGYEVGTDTVIPQAQQNDTIFVKASCTLGLQNIEHLGSLSLIKTFDTGAVTFTCAGKTIIMKGDTQFNGGKGSTAVVSIHNNDCYIRISNV
jgi:hypothetical protein